MNNQAEIHPFIKSVMNLTNETDENPTSLPAEAMPDESKPVLNMKFLQESLGLRNSVVADFALAKKHFGDDYDNITFTTMCVSTSIKKGCVAIIHEKIRSDKYTQMIRILTARHNALPPNDPSKLNASQIIKEVDRYAQKEMAKQAITLGASLVITSVPIEDYPCVVVKNVFSVLLMLAREYARRFDVTSIAVTGSAGKTTACQFVLDMLLANGKIVHRNRLNQNDYLGAFTTAANLNFDHEYLIQETQEAPVAETAELVSMILAPKIGIITNAGASHLKDMKTKANVVAACLGIQDGMPKDGLLIVNGDDHALKKKLRKPKIPTLFYSMRNKDADYYAENIQSTYSGITFDIVHKGSAVPVKISTLGEHNVYNAMAAFITGKRIGLTDEEAANGIAAYLPSGIRQNLVEVKNRTLYIDCFSATPESMSESIARISNTPTKNNSGKRVVVLTGIRALGTYSEQGHKKVSDAILDSNIDTLICYGLKAITLIAEAVKDKPDLKIIKELNFERMVNILKEETGENDLVLFKGNWYARLGRIIDTAFGTYFALGEQEYLSEKKPKNAKSLYGGTYKIVVHTSHTMITEFEGDVKIISFKSIVTTMSTRKPHIIFGIGEKAFVGNASLESIIIPGTVKAIGDEAFCNCAKLAKVYIPPSVVNIGRDAFFNTPATIFGISGTMAEEYARSNNITFVDAPIQPDSSQISFSSMEVSKITDLGILVLSDPDNPKSFESNTMSDAELILKTQRGSNVFANEITLYAAKQLFSGAEDYGFEEVYAAKCCDENHHEHMTGMAIDILIGNMSTDEFKDSLCAKWMLENAHSYGFLVYEDMPWHFRFVGKIHAHYIHQNGLTLKEYINLLQDKKRLEIDYYGASYFVFYEVPEDDAINIPTNFNLTISSDGLGGYIVDGYLIDLYI